MGKVIAVCTSERKGLQKSDVKSAHFTTEWGIDGDAHAGKWHRQISLLSADKIAAFNEKGANVIPGAFGENLVVEGFDFRSLPVGTLLRCGDCIMPREGVFARVIEPGTITVGDEMVIEKREGRFPWQTAIITLSDKGSAGQRKDESGPAIAKRLADSGYDVVEELLIPDDERVLKQELMRLCDQRQLDLILTTGGTGCSPRDTTPEATLAVADRNVPGIAEAMRAASLKITPYAMISRAASVIRGKTLIINLPGSPRACMENMDVFMDTIPHAMGLLRNEVHDCARK